jgi:hypothetical protein
MYCGVFIELLPGNALLCDSIYLITQPALVLILFSTFRVISQVRWSHINWKLEQNYRSLHTLCCFSPLDNSAENASVTLWHPCKWAPAQILCIHALLGDRLMGGILRQVWSGILTLVLIVNFHIRSGPLIPVITYITLFLQLYKVTSTESFMI